MNEIGIPIKVAQSRSGFTRPSTIIDIYAGDISSKLDEEAAQQLDELITPIKIDLHRRRIRDLSMTCFTAHIWRVAVLGPPHLLCPRRDSNPQPTDSKSGTLSIELRGHFVPRLYRNALFLAINRNCAPYRAQFL